MLIGNLEANRQPIEERFATAIGSTPLLMGDLCQLTHEQREWYRAKIAWFKKLRHDVAMQQGFFPLGSWRQPNVAEWDGFARLSRTGEGMIVIFKNSSPAQEATVSLPVPGDTAYHIHSVTAEQTLGVFRGTQLRSGIAFPLRGAADIFEIRRLA
jgi:hypothetical protein